MSRKVRRSFKPKTSSDKFNILVVDDDPTSLSIVSALLKTWHYEAMTVKSPVEALATVRARHDRIDLVLTDLHMPEMNGIELQKQIHEECNHLPVIIMSSDDRESVILESIASGAAFYIVKPINPDDLKDVWQYAVTSMKRKSMHIEETESFHSGGSSAHMDISTSASSVNQDTHERKKNNKRKHSERGKEYMEGETVVAPRKAKVIWTNSLHSRFLQAINHISLEKAVPKKILEFMNIPGLTRENVASHLQKYRIFLKRVAEKGASVTTKNYSTEKNVMSSSFAASGQSSLLRNHSQQDSQQFQGKQPMRNAFQPAGHGGCMWAFNGANIGARLGASSSSLSQLGSQLENQANVYQPNFGNTNALYLANPSNGFETNLFSFGDIPGGLMSGTNSAQIYHRQTQARPDLNSGTPGIVHNLPPNYSEMPINDDTETPRIGQNTPNGNFLNGGGSFINPAHNDNISIGPTGSATFGYFRPGVSSSVGFDPAHYPLQPAFACVNQQGSNPALPPLLPQQYDLVNNGQNNFIFDLINSASVFGNPRQLGEGNVPNILLGTTDYPFPYQQVGEGFLNPNFPGNSNFAEVNSRRNPSTNQDFSSALSVEAKNEPTLDQENGNTTINDYFPIFNRNPDNQQQGNEHQVNFEINDLRVDNVLSGNQEWNDDFLNSLLDGRPF